MYKECNAYPIHMSCLFKDMCYTYLTQTIQDWSIGFRRILTIEEKYSGGPTL